MGTRPIGIFDSGVGGLSVAREIHRALPRESLLYVADTAWCPYGDRPAGEVRERALAVGRHLQHAGAKLVVAACNTASGAALEHLREVLHLPVVGLEPAVKTGVSLTRNQRVGVMATAGTLRSDRYARLLAAHAAGVEVVPQPCPGLVELIEEGELEGEAMAARLRELTGPLRAAGVDTVVLGCTHYPFVQGAIAQALGGDVTLVDSGPAIARRTEHLLRHAHLLAPRNGGGDVRVLTTGDPARVAPVVARLWGATLPVDAVEI